MIKLFASDLDGTLLNKNHESDEIVLDAIDSVINDGKYFVLATGRPYKEAIFEKGFKQRNLYVVCLNGSLCYQPGKSLLYKEFVDKNFLEALLDTFKGEYIECFDEYHEYTTIDKETYIEEYRKMFCPYFGEEHFDETIETFTAKIAFNVSKEELLSKDVLKVHAFQRVKDIQKLIDQYPTVINAPSNEYMYEITNANATKAKGIKHLANILNIKDDEIAVFGDGGNDVDMLTTFKNSYAPASAYKEALDAANYICQANEEYGVPKKIKELLKEK